MNVKLKEKREELGLSRKALAELSGIPYTTLRKMETEGHNPGIIQCLKVIHALNCWGARFVGFFLLKVEDIFVLESTD